MVDHQIHLGFVDEAHVIPCPLAFEHAPVAPDDTVKTGNVVRIKRRLTSLVVDDVVKYQLVTHDRVADVLAGILAKEFDIGQTYDLSIFVDLQFRIRFSQEVNVRLPKDVAGERGRLVSAPSGGADVEAARAAVARVADVDVERLHVQIRRPQDGFPMAFDLDVVGDTVRGIRAGRACEGIEARLRFREVVGL